MFDIFNPFELMMRGGIFMWPILVCSVIGLAIAIERFVSLRRADIDTREFMDTMRQVLRQNRVQEAIQICDATNAPVARIMKAGIMRHRGTKEDIREAMEDASHLEIPRLERYLSGLATCSNVSPLLGLLGTVQGMIICFAQIQTKGGQVNPSDLAGGISTALLTTAFGLSVAIPLLVLYNFFTSQISTLIAGMEISAAELLELLTRHRGDREI